jgi:SAM-dependent methyltransferase
MYPRGWLPRRSRWLEHNQCRSLSYFPARLIARTLNSLHFVGDAESIDTVVVTWTLCSIPNPLRALQQMGRLLKPYGQLFFVEHGRSSDPGVVVWQDRITPLWKRIGGGCHLNRSPRTTRSSSASDVEKKSVGVRAGRQELAFGDERLLGNANWPNTARSFDALRGTIRHGGFRADLFAARVVKLHDGEFDWSTPGNNLYGVYGGIEKRVPSATVEPYFLWRRQSALKTELGMPGISNFGTVGVRWVGKLPANLDYGTEMDKQAGSLGTDTITAWAGHWLLGKTLINTRFKPHFSVEYNYASGNPTDGTRSTFDQLYPTGHDKYGLDDQVGWKNIRNARAGVDLKLAKKWGLTNRYDAWWLADPHDALYTAASTVVARNTAGTAGRFVGQELDSVVAYTFSKYLQVSGGYGHIFPGTFLNHTTPGESYNFPYASTTLVF